MSKRSARRRDREEDDDDEKQELLAEKRELTARLKQGGLSEQLEIAIRGQLSTINNTLTALYSSRNNNNNNSANTNINNNNSNAVATSVAAAASSSLNNNNNNSNAIDFDVSATRLDRMSSQQLVALLRHRFGVSAPILKVLIDCDVSGASFAQEDFVTTNFTPQLCADNKIIAATLKVFSEAHGKLWRNFRRFEWSRNERKPETPMQNNVPLLRKLLIANETVSFEIADWVLSFVSSAEQLWSLDLDDIAATLHGWNFVILSKRGGGDAALLGVVVKLEPEEDVINNSNNNNAVKVKTEENDSSAQEDDDEKEIDVDAVASSVFKQLQVLKSERWNEIKSQIPNDVLELVFEYISLESAEEVHAAACFGSRASASEIERHAGCVGNDRSPLRPCWQYNTFCD